MERLIDGPLAEVLERGRERFNARFVYARQLNRRLDPAEFAELLIAVVDPIVREAARKAPDSVDRVTEALYDISLELLGRECLGNTPRVSSVDRVWRTFLPAIPHLLVQEPRRVAASISNAVYNMALEPSVRAECWIEAMSKLAFLCEDAATFLKAGQVTAWRCGMAHYRDGALAVWRELPDNLMQAVLDLPTGQASPDREELFTALSDTWGIVNAPEEPGKNKLTVQKKVGGFRGFGGPFICPPEVTVADGVLYAYDSEFCWSIHADRFGATFQRFGKDIPTDAGPGNRNFRVDQDGAVVKNKTTTRFPIFRTCTSFASTDATLAVTLPRSHLVFLVA